MGCSPWGCKETEHELSTQAYLPLEYQLLFVLESFMYGHYVLVLFLSTFCLSVVHVAIDTHSSFIFVVLYSVV